MDKKIIKKLNIELIKNKIINKDKLSETNNIIINNYNKINEIKNDSINRINKIRLSKTYNEYNYYNRIYKWNNNIILNEINKDKIVKIWIKYILNSKINISKILLNNKKISSLIKGDKLNELTKLYSNEPVFLHTNDILNIYIRILIPFKINLISGSNKISKHYINIINKLLLSNILNNSIIRILLNKLYGKKVNIIPIFINNTSGGMNEFVIGDKLIYSPYRYNIIMNKLNKYIIPKSTIYKNSYINKNLLYNLIYLNNINNKLDSLTDLNNEILNNRDKSVLLLPNKESTILSNLNNRYITGYNIYYAGKLPKADSSARTIKRNSIVGTIHLSGLTNKTLHYYNNNGLASTKATIAQAPNIK